MAEKERNYELEYRRDQAKRKKYRASLRKERVKRGLTDKDGTANGNGDKHVAHKKYARGKAGGETTVKSAHENLSDQPKRRKRS